MFKRLLRSCLASLVLISASITFAEVTLLPQQKPIKPAAPALLEYRLIRTIPRETGHFTEGLVFADNRLFESTGHYGNSKVYAYSAKDFALLQHTELPADAFGEGLTSLGGRLYQLDWKGNRIFVYDLQLQYLHSLPLQGDGWGLTTDGQSLIMSDGSDTIFFRDPLNAREVKRITVKDTHGTAWKNLNELEWVNGVILANVWHLDTVLVIDPASGNILGQYAFEKLSQITGKRMPGRTGEQVLNGIAWNPATGTLLVTGKDWPLWFEVALLSIPSPDTQGP